VQFPLYFLGFFFFARSASLILIVWITAQIVAAMGLLKLKNWSLLATIGFGPNLEFKRLTVAKERCPPDVR
jgi:hypothetical protein